MTAPGRAARAKGHRAERAVVAWLRAHGHPEAATTRHRLGHDGWHAPGDVIGVPGLVIEVKDVAASAFPTWCRQAEEEAQGTPWCVVRRTPRVVDVGAWPCVASLDAITGPVHHSPLSLIQIVRRIESLPAGHWLAGRDGYAAGRFGDLFDEQSPDPRPTECGFCEGGRLTVRTTSFAALLAGGDGREVPCPYCHGTGLAP